ncbi:MAG: glutamate racemase [Paludibacteraceae bacterium]|nr:glutamate racemase [Paludibacteraceae bacterium]
MIGVFDSGYGGLTILKQIRELLPEYDYIYLGDNARAPYGTRSFECIYHYTLEAVRYLQQQGCTLIILACNTASAKALRTIQQHDIDPQQVRVLGVIRPTVEVVPSLTQTGHVGVLATPGTVASDSYRIELMKQDDSLTVTQLACPMWVPLIEAGEHESEGAKYFISKYVQEIVRRDPKIDTLLLGCTHYPLIQAAIDAELAKADGRRCTSIAQGGIVAQSLKDYLHRHPEIEQRLQKGGECKYLTTDDSDKFADAATLFLGSPVRAMHVDY